MAYLRHNFQNGQYVDIEQTTASIGHRILAKVIDFILLYFYCILDVAIIVITSKVSDTFSMIAAVVITLIPVLYEPICEQIWGQTLGKKMLGIRVVMQNGEAVSMSGSLLRWLLSTIDYLCGLGIVVMFCNSKNMRLGDLAGGTIVVSDHSKKDQKAFEASLKQFTYLDPDYTPKYAFAAELRWGQISFINHTMLRNDREYCSQQRRRNIEQLAHMLAEKFDVDGIDAHNSNAFLRRIVADYNYFTWDDK